MKYLYLGLLLLLSYRITAQCAVPNYVITDKTTAIELLAIKYGSSVQERKGKSFIWRLQLIGCEYSPKVIQMVTRSGVYWFEHDEVHLYEWINAPDVVQYYNDNVRDSENWRHPEFPISFRCTAIRKGGKRCLRSASKESSRCWQHPF